MTYDVAGLDFLHAGKGDWGIPSWTAEDAGSPILLVSVVAAPRPITTGLPPARAAACFWPQPPDADPPRHNYLVLNAAVKG